MTQEYIHIFDEAGSALADAGEGCPTKGTNIANTNYRVRQGGPYGTRSRRRGFSFTEILFAVMILGIGFIMVAAVFPVAIKETEETVEETTASSVAKSGSSYFARIGIDNNASNLHYLTQTAGKVVNYIGPTPSGVQENVLSFWQALSGNLILSSDARYAWVPFYSRLNGSNYAQITMIAVQCRNGPTFTAADLQTIGASPPNLEGRPLTATFSAGANPNLTGTNPDTISFSSTTTPSFVGAVSEGCYVILADDSTANPNGVSCDGYIYRVGVNRGGNTWELMPGGDMKNARYSPAGETVQVFVVGRGYNNAAGSDATLTGPAMDVGAFASFVKIH